MWLNRWASPAKRGLRSKICVCVCACLSGNATLSWALAMAGKQIGWKELEEVHNTLPTDAHTHTHPHKDMVWEDYTYTQHISLHIHRLSASHSQRSVCLWQPQSSRLSVRNWTCTHMQTRKETFNVKAAVLDVQSGAPQCPSLKGVTQQESFHWKVLRNYRHRNSLHSRPLLSSCAGPAPPTHWWVIIGAWMEMTPPAATEGWNTLPVTSARDGCITLANGNIAGYIYRH